MFRSDIQALRAVAVCAVVIFHLWPSALSGGYVGVDVFFVISGFLITSHLLREIEATGRIDLPAFWVRRIKRLQPAALMVLLFSLIGIVLWVPRGLWLGWLQELTASALWVENWLLGFNSVDYLAASNAPSPAQHYWSLSVEEQFYFGFPLLLAFLIWRAKKTGGISRRWIVGGLYLVAVISFSYSLWLTIFSPSFAFFSTVTRAWEFAAGALLATIGASAPNRLRHAAALFGVMLILISCRIFDHATSFPGSAALLPVAGTVLCLWAGRASLLETFGKLRLIAALGRYSYAIYLWHWPLLILAPWTLLHWPFDLAAPYMGERGKNIIIATLSILLGALTTHYVEDPVRFSPRLLGGVRRKRVVFICFIGALLALLCILAIPFQSEHQRQAAISKKLAHIQRVPIDELPPCFGAAAMAHGNKGCLNLYLNDIRLPDVSLVIKDDANRQECWNTNEADFNHICFVGVKYGYTKRILAVGDSHAVTLLDAYQHIAENNSWRIDVTGFRGYYLTFSESSWSGKLKLSTEKWKNFIFEQAQKNDYDAYLFTHSRSSSFVAQSDGKSMQQTIVDGLVTAWSALPPAPIIALVDNPGTGPGQNIVQCYLRNAQDEELSACDLQRKEALPFDGSAEAAAQLPNAKAIDLTDFYCNETTCPAVIGNVIVYRDDNHITRTWAKTLAPYLNREIVAALAELGQKNHE